MDTSPSVTRSRDADPERLQVVHEGQRVRVRGRIWEVREAPQVEGGQILTLAPVADATAPDLRVLYPVEQVEVIDHQQMAWHVGSGHGFQLLHDGIRLSLKTPPDRILANRLGRLQVEPYQFDPVLKAFRRPLQRLLIADDVGLGKTVEAILIMLELIARGRGNRILIVVPAGLQDQWRDDELYRKAGLEFEIFDSDRIREVRREYARGTNPWTTRNRVIASMDFLKRDDIRRMLKGVRWDLVIVDEAHYLAESVSGNNVYKTARSRLGEFLASTQVTDNLKLARSLDPFDDSKARALVEKLKAIAAGPQGEKVIIFSEYRDTLEFLAGKDTPEGHVDGLLDRAGFKGQVVTLTGGMPRKDRRAVEAAFHRPEIRILVGTDAASEGLNLQRQCRLLIHYELPWNPNRMIQRNGRIDRWGQKAVKPVQIFNLYRPKAKDDDILGLLLWKIEEIRRDLGSAADVIGASSDLDIETLLLTRGGIKQDDADARQSKQEAEQAIQKSLSEQRQRMAQWQSESVLASARFGKEDHLRVERELAAGSADLVGEVGVEAVVREVLARLQGRIEPAGPERIRIIVPQGLRRGGLARDELPAATFNRSLAAAAETEDLEFLGVSHPLVQSAATRIRASLWDPQGLFAGDRIASRVVDTAPGVGIVFTFLGLLSQKRYWDGRTVDLPYAEYLLPVFVSVHGDVSEDLQADHELLEATAVPGVVPTSVWENKFQSALPALMQTAREEAGRRLGVLEKHVMQKVAQQAETLRRDALEWRDARQQWIQEQLAGPAKNQLFYDDEGEHITWQEAAERRERRLKNEQARLQLLHGQRLSEVDAMGQVQASGELTWVGALLVVPSYELPHIAGGTR